MYCTALCVQYGTQKRKGGRSLAIKKKKDADLAVALTKLFFFILINVYLSIDGPFSGHSSKFK